MPYTPCGLIVEPPKITPDKFGLLSVANPVTPEDPHWQGGITWDDDYCSDVHSTEVGSCPIPVTGSTPLVSDRDFNACCADPFLIYGSYDCPPVGRLGQEAFDIATNRLLIRENRAVEKVFWTGKTEDNISVSPSLSFGNSSCGIVPVDLTPVAGPLSVVSAMARLESALGECSPGAGVIHANYGLASYLASEHLIFPSGDAWYTITGQRLAFGAGYPGSGPNGVAAAAGTSWIFATGPVGIWRSEVFLTPERFVQAMDRRLNSVEVYAQRAYSVGFSCCLFAVKVSLC